MRISINNSRDFLALLVRRKWWVMGTFIGLTGALTLLVYFLPKIYVSETLILLQPRDVGPDLVPNPYTGSPEQRLKAIEQTVLSRTNLLQILREFEERMPEFRGLNKDDQVIKLRDQIHIVFELQRQSGVTLPLTYFRISYQDGNPELAQKIASKLTALFIEKDNEQRVRQVNGTLIFFTEEVKNIAKKLEDSEETLSKIKLKRLNTLPETREPNLRTLERLTNDKKANSEALDRIVPLRLTLEQQIAETPDKIQKPVVVRQIPAPAPPTQIKPQQTPIKPPPQPDPLAVQAKALGDEVLKARLLELQKAKLELDDALINHTPNHPDVRSARSRLDRAKALVPPELAAELLEPSKPPAKADVTETATTAAATLEPASNDPAPAPAFVEVPVEMMPNPVYRSLVGQLKQLDTEYAIRVNEKTFIDAEIAKYAARVESTPAVEQEIASVLRENNDLRRQHTDLSGKLAQAELVKNLEDQQKGAQFQIVDFANIPLSPEKPRKPMIAMWAGVFSLLFAIVLAFVIDVSRQRVWAASEVETLWNVPVLVDIPEIAMESDEGANRRKWRLQLTSAMAAAAVYGACLYGIYLYQSSILRQLDPLLQRIIYR